MMALIVLAAIILAAEKARRRRVFCQQKISLAADIESRYRRVAATADQAVAEFRVKYEKWRAETDPGSALVAEQIKESLDRFTEHAKDAREMAARAERLKAQYERAAFRPWESLPTDLLGG
jgi:hypothetical protein